MKKAIRTLALMMVVMTLITTNPVVFAAELPTEDIVEPNGPKYQFKTEYMDPVYVSNGAYAEGQPEMGISLKTPYDAIHYIPGGGFTFSTNVSISLPQPFDMISVGFDMASYTTAMTGVSAALGEKQPGFYKVYVILTYEVIPYVVYRKHSGAQYTDWEVASVGVYTQSLYKVEHILRIMEPIDE